MTHDAPVPRRWYALVVLSLAQLMVVLGDSIVNVSLPETAAALQMDDASRAWAITAYVLPFGGLLLIAGRVADTVGRKRAFIIGLLGFAAASALGGAAGYSETYFLSRALQGACAALLTPAALSLITVTFTDPRERVRAFGVYGAVSGAGASLGVVLGGLLTEVASWRWCLLVNVPIALVAAAAALVVVNESRTSARQKYDVAGAALVTIGLTAAVWGFTEAADSSVGWGATRTLLLLGLGLVLLILFVVVEARGAHPLVPLSLVLDRTRGPVLLGAVFVNAGLFALFLFLAFYLQTELGMSPLVSGVAFLPFSGAMALTAIVVPRFTHRLGHRTALLFGTSTAVAGLVYLSVLPGSGEYAVGVLPAEVLVGVGLGFVFVGQPSLVMHEAPASDVGTTSALLNTAQQVGGALGTALLSTVFVAVATTPDLTTRAYQLTFLASAALVAAAALLALALPTRRNTHITEGVLA